MLLWWCTWPNKRRCGVRTKTATACKKKETFFFYQHLTKEKLMFERWKMEDTMDILIPMSGGQNNPQSKWYFPTEPEIEYCCYRGGLQSKSTGTLLLLPQSAQPHQLLLPEEMESKMSSTSVNHRAISTIRQGNSNTTSKHCWHIHTEKKQRLIG